MLSKQIKQAYIKTTITVSLITLIMLSLYSVSAVLFRLDIVILLIVFIFILMGFTAFFSVMFIKLSSRFLNQTVHVIKADIIQIHDDTLNQLSFGQHATIFEQERFIKEEIFTIRAYNFKYACITDQNDIRYVISTDDIEVHRD